MSTKTHTDIDWYNNQNNVVELATYLKSKDFFTSLDDMLYFFEKPWKYDSQFVEYQLSREAES